MYFQPGINKKMAYLQNPFENFLFKGRLLFFSVSIKEFLKKKKKKGELSHLHLTFPKSHSYTKIFVTVKGLQRAQK